MDTHTPTQNTHTMIFTIDYYFRSSNNICLVNGLHHEKTNTIKSSTIHAGTGIKTSQNQIHFIKWIRELNKYRTIVLPTPPMLVRSIVECIL